MLEEPEFGCLMGTRAADFMPEALVGDMQQLTNEDYGAEWPTGGCIMDFVRTHVPISSTGAEEFSGLAFDFLGTDQSVPDKAGANAESALQEYMISDNFSDGSFDVFDTEATIDAITSLEVIPTEHTRQNLKRDLTKLDDTGSDKEAAKVDDAGSDKKAAKVDDTGSEKTATKVRRRAEEARLYKFGWKKEENGMLGKRPSNVYTSPTGVQVTSKKKAMAEIRLTNSPARRNIQQLL